MNKLPSFYNVPFYEIKEKLIVYTKNINCIFRSYHLVLF